MSYEFTKLSNVPAVSEFPEGANAIIETNGEIKRCPSSNVPKPLTYDYMPEGYPSKAMGTVTVMEEQELAFAHVANGVYAAFMDTALDIVVGKTYTVNWGGTEYQRVCVDDGKGNRLLGNTYIMGNGIDTGEPFLYDFFQKAFATLDTSASHTISVKTTVETVTPMAEEFLPAIALITYDLSTDTYSSDFTNGELYARLLDGKHIVLYTTDGNQYLYLTKWRKLSSGRIDLAFAGENYSVSLNTDGTIGKKPLE